MRGEEVGGGRALILTVRILAAVGVALAFMCAGPAIAWKREHDTAACYADVADQDRVPQDRECGP